MFESLLHQVALLNVELTENTELAAIEMAAAQAAKAWQLDQTAIRASLLASEVQGAHYVGQQAVILEASSDQLKTPRAGLITLARPVAWGADNDTRMIDQLVILVMTQAHTATEQARLEAQVTQHLALGVPTAPAAAAKFARHLLVD